MKYKYFLLILLTVLLIRCKKDDAPKLPAVTQSGANTFGCKIDGKVFVPKGSAFFQKLNTYLTNNQLQINAGNKTGDNVMAVNLYIDGLEIKEGQKLTLSAFGTAGSASAFVSDNLTEYRIHEPLTGVLEITKFDTQARVIAGTFNFEAIDTAGQKIVVTDGRFDLKF